MLRIIQSNADGLSAKMQELRDRLEVESIEVRLIQETKLVEKDASSPFPGYNSIRVAPPHQLTLIKESIVFLRVVEEHIPPLERLNVQIELFRRRWATTYKSYVVPVKGPTPSDSIDLNDIDIGPFTLVVGDLNTDFIPLGRTPVNRPARRDS